MHAILRGGKYDGRIVSVSEPAEAIDCVEHSCLDLSIPLDEQLDKISTAAVSIIRYERTSATEPEEISGNPLVVFKVKH